jgi:hypothetical protein
MNTPRRLILTASLIATLASIAPLASAADTSPQNHGTTMDQCIAHAMSSLTARETALVTPILTVPTKLQSDRSAR